MRRSRKTAIEQRIQLPIESLLQAVELIGQYASANELRVLSTLTGDRLMANTEERPSTQEWETKAQWLLDGAQKRMGCGLLENQSIPAEEQIICKQEDQQLTEQQQEYSSSYWQQSADHTANATDEDNQIENYQSEQYDLQLQMTTKSAEDFGKICTKPVAYYERTYYMETILEEEEQQAGFGDQLQNQENHLMSQATEIYSQHSGQDCHLQRTEEIKECDEEIIPPTEIITDRVLIQTQPNTDLIATQNQENDLDTISELNLMKQLRFGSQEPSVYTDIDHQNGQALEICVNNEPVGLEVPSTPSQATRSFMLSPKIEKHKRAFFSPVRSKPSKTVHSAKRVFFSKEVEQPQQEDISQLFSPAMRQQQIIEQEVQEQLEYIDMISHSNRRPPEYSVDVLELKQNVRDSCLPQLYTVEEGQEKGKDEYEKEQLETIHEQQPLSTPALRNKGKNKPQSSRSANKTQRPITDYFSSQQRPGKFNNNSVCSFEGKDLSKVNDMDELKVPTPVSWTPSTKDEGNSQNQYKQEQDLEQELAELDVALWNGEFTKQLQNKRSLTPLSLEVSKLSDDEFPGGEDKGQTTKKITTTSEQKTFQGGRQLYPINEQERAQAECPTKQQNNAAEIISGKSAHQVYSGNVSNSSSLQQDLQMGKVFQSSSAKPPVGCQESSLSQQVSSPKLIQHQQNDNALSQQQVNNQQFNWLHGVQRLTSAKYISSGNRVEDAVQVVSDICEQNKQTKVKRANMITNGIQSLVPPKSEAKKINGNIKPKIPALEQAKKAKQQDEEKERKRQQEKARRALKQPDKQQKKPVAHKKTNQAGIRIQQAVLGGLQVSNTVNSQALQSQQQSATSTSEKRRQAEWASKENIQRYFSQPQLNPYKVFKVPSGAMTDREFYEVFPHLRQSNSKRERDSMDWDHDQYDSDEKKRYDLFQNYKRLRSGSLNSEGFDKENT
eukprot:TRINITY_DN8148_c0_g2_i1.p1 TRINITY_DN8148_c0_g2~~TRINITY_DN8148_c0_g2_i1.p1  ORF type:complete len:951 (-),score=91.54 TRINITY_DN8148_c0_g2_i1:727-3579(-)